MAVVHESVAGQKTELLTASSNVRVRRHSEDICSGWRPDAAGGAAR